MNNFELPFLGGWRTELLNHNDAYSGTRAGPMVVKEAQMEAIWETSPLDPKAMSPALRSTPPGMNYC